MNIEQALQNSIGMGVKEFIVKMIEGGAVGHLPHTEIETLMSNYGGEIEQSLLNPKAWEAVGKTEGWEQRIDYGDGHTPSHWDEPWKEQMHFFVDELTALDK